MTDDLTAQHQLILEQRRSRYNATCRLVTAQLDMGLQSNTTSLAEHSITTTNTINASTAQCDDKSIISKMTEFHQHIDSRALTINR